MKDNLRFIMLLVLITILCAGFVSAAGSGTTIEDKTNITHTDDGKILVSNGTYWISWDPIGDHIVGDQFFINGTTNLSAGTEIYLYLIAPGGSCRTKICNRKSAGTGGYTILKPGTTYGINTFSLLFNTTDIQSNQYFLYFDIISSPSQNPAEIDAFYRQEGLVDSTIFLFPEDWRSITARSKTTHPDAGISYWISVSNVVEYTRPCYQLTGTTNLPPGETLSYSFFSPVEYGPDHNVDPIRNLQGLFRGGIVVPGEKSGINRFNIPINTYNSSEWTNVIIWNPRYNTSDLQDSISTSTEFHPSSDVQNVSTTCSVPLPTTAPTLPLSLMGTFGALVVFYVYVR
jgi:hypothetical protein